MQQIQASHETVISDPATTPHIVGAGPDLLRHIHDPGVNLCLWQRPAKPEVSQELAPLKAPDLPDVRCATSPNSFADDVSMLLQQQGLEPLAFKHWRADMRHLAGIYFGLSGKHDVTLRLVTTEEDDCRRFHVDRTRLRLLCTYRGPGTEWLADEQLDRLAQRTGAPNEEIIRLGEPRRFEPFWVGILKGDAFPGNTGHGLVHRSPPVARSGKMRVLFCLDC